jgi:hypothetical protein
VAAEEDTMWRLRLALSIAISTVPLSNTGAAGDDNTIPALESAQKQIVRDWPGSVERGVNVAAKHCAGRQVPTRVLSPAVLYQGHVEDMAVSTAGAVAIADISKSLVLVFATTGSREASLQVPLGQGFVGNSLVFSQDGHFLAWATPFETYIYDVIARRFALTLDQFEARQVQWIGDDLLLIGNDDYNMNVTTTSLFRLKEGVFQRDVLNTVGLGNRYVRRDSSAPAEDNFAISDQLGRSYLSPKGLYASLADALRDHATIIVHKDANYSERLYRIGEHLIQPSDNGNLFQKPDRPWSLLLRDGTSGNVLKSVPLPMPWCAPNGFSIAGDGSEIAMLVGTSLLILDPTDLTVQSIYGLDAPSLAMPESVALVPGGKVVVWAQSLNPEQQSIFVYSLGD